MISDDQARAWYAAADPVHNFDHILRVANMAERLARAEGADPEVVRAAALLHDIARPQQEEDGRPHQESAADFARELLLGQGHDPARVEQVIHAILAHRFRDQRVRPQILEAMCLYDADKLDAIGAIGVARAFAYGGGTGQKLWVDSQTLAREQRSSLSTGNHPDHTPVHEYLFKLRLLYDTLYTETARQIGRDRHAFMVAFYERLDAEMQGRA